MRGFQYFIANNLVGFIMACIVYIGITGGLGAWLAERKGYSAGAWFVLCFLTGPFGLIALAGAPSMDIELAIYEIKKKLAEQPSGNASGGVPSAPPLSAGAAGQTWFCRQCKAENPAAVNACKICGEYRQ